MPSAAKAIATIAILGLPNVGKSTLFNKLTGRRTAVVFDREGVTRDCRNILTKLKNTNYYINLVDTPGVLTKSLKQDNTQKKEHDFISAQELEKIMFSQTFNAIAEADLVVFLFDGKIDFLAEHEVFFNKVRRAGKKIIAAVNKCEGRQGNHNEIYEMGLSPIFVSAEHSIGIDELIRSIDSEIKIIKKECFEREIDREIDENNFEGEGIEDGPYGNGPYEHGSHEHGSHEDDFHEDGYTEDQSDEPAENEDRCINLSIIGRPNVGKSTLINALLQRQAQIVANIPGVTRETIEFDWTYKGKFFKLSDTAGIRKRAKIDDYLEKISVTKSFDSIDYSHVCVLVVDSTDVEKTDFGELLKQDLLIASKVIEEGRCVVIALNKWDIVENRTKLTQRVKESINAILSQASGVSIVPISASKSRGLDDLLREVIKNEEIWNERISTSKLNNWLRDTISKNPPPATNMRRSKLKYITQVNSRPPSFVVFCTKIADIPESYKKFLINRLRESFGLLGIPIRLQFRQQANPYAKKANKPKR